MNPHTLAEQNPLTGTAIFQAGMAQTYEDVKLMILKAAHKWSRIYQVPFDDMVSAANEVFVNSFYRYQPERMARPTKFSTYLNFALHMDLCTYMNKQKKNINHNELNEEIYDFEVVSYDIGYRTALEEELTEDAKYVVSLLLDAPEDFQELIKLREVKKKNDMKWALREYLIASGWKATRVTAAFDLVKEKL